MAAARDAGERDGERDGERQPDRKESRLASTREDSTLAEQMLDDWSHPYARKWRKKN